MQMKRMPLIAVVLSLVGCATSESDQGIGTTLQKSFDKALQETLHKPSPQQQGGGVESNTGATKGHVITDDEYQRMGQGASAPKTLEYARLTDTKLKEIFQRYPVKDDLHPPAFPRVAIRIESFSDSLGASHMMSTHSADQCMTYSITFWADARTPEKFERLKMCYPDIDRSFTGLSPVFACAPIQTQWKIKLNLNKNSGQVRNDGPVGPSSPYPSDSVAADFMNGWGACWLGSVFTQLGYDYTYPHDTMRVWVTGVSRSQRN